MMSLVDDDEKYWSSLDTIVKCWGSIHLDALYSTVDKYGYYISCEVPDIDGKVGFWE